MTRVTRRTRRARPDLTDSWDDVDDSSDFDDDIKEELSDEAYEQDERLASTTITRDFADAGDARSRASRSSAASEFVMPASPNGGSASTKPRAKTPHLRSNDRSLTSDAGDLDADRIKPRDKTPRMRINERSLTSDAGDMDAARVKPRDQTPRFRMNERSLTSDAGDLDASRIKARDQTPRFRMNERSLTSDAGKFARKYSGQSFDGTDEEDEGDDSSSLPILIWNQFLRPLLAYTRDIVQITLDRAKPLLSFLLLAYLIGALLIFGSNFINNTITNALSPICRIPGVSYLFSPSFCPARVAAQVEGIAEFDKLVQAQSAFDEVLEASAAGANLPIEMKRSEASIRDLKHVVQYSTLPSRNELVFEFNGFVDTARQASQDLSRFNSRIGRAVDHILSTNRWTLSIIDGVAATEAGRGSISKFFSEHLNIFAPFYPVSLSQDVLLDQYLRHTSAVEDQLLTLITEAQALLNILENLDGRLDVIAGISTRDGLKTEEAREEIFAFLWTKLGGNRHTVKRYEQQLTLLRQVDQYRRIAWAHVTATIVKLQAIRSDIEDLRERVAMPETVGLEKVPLEVHIQAINLGIERLERQRDASRLAERESYSKVMGKAEAGDERLIGHSEI